MALRIHGGSRQDPKLGFKTSVTAVRHNVFDNHFAASVVIEPRLSERD